jgi:undecaprenyl-diphosphatase
VALTYPEALIVGLTQGVTELFPVSSLGHSVLLPAIIGGRWAHDLDVSAQESPYLAFIVGLHVATALALLVFFRADWVRIIRGFGTSIRHRQITTSEQRLAWLVVLATVPVGIAGLALEHTFRTVLGKPVPAAAFLLANGLMLFAGERLRRAAADPGTADRSAADPSAADPGTADWSAADRSAADRSAADRSAADRSAAGPRVTGPRTGPGGVAVSGQAVDPDVAADRRLGEVGVRTTLIVGAAQVLALLPGISRSGATMVAGLVRGLSHEDAARFSFLLATPVILAAGVLKLPDLAGPLGAGIRGQVLVGSLAAGLAAYASVRWLTRWFSTRTLTPFAVYCVLAGGVSLAVLAAR